MWRKFSKMDIVKKLILIKSQMKMLAMLDNVTISISVMNIKKN